MVLIALVATFEIGSIVCAAAPTSNALIVGRVIQGIGGAGISSGAFMLINVLIPLQSHPKYAGALGSVFGIASVIGPIAGGYLTAITWRWCFWINLPVGAISLVLVVLLTPKSPAPVKPADTRWGKVDQLDPLGFILMGPSIVCLLFTTEWGGTRYPWNDARIIVLFVVFVILGLAFLAAQVWRKEKATVPPQIFFQRSIFMGSIAIVGIGSGLVIFPCYLPIWFQVIQSKSPQNSGLSLIPLLLSVVVAVMGGGIATSLLGYYTPFMIAGSAILVVGSALITTWKADIGAGIWIITRSSQGLDSVSDISVGLAVLNFFSFLGGSVFITVSQTVLEENLNQGLGKIIPDLDSSTLANRGATSLSSMVSTDKLSQVLDIYNHSMRSIWYLALALSSLIFMASWVMEWKSVKKAHKSDEALP
ncbi:uncharacterized protein KY384_009010 [Bacidia gigantensis]|uniref:uncharacterized protein n=1 Tax=Bacidia gigantensis TaxID=2732470 RepID=UPI001D046C17|nr:uncharacterized protein KY384_009010 [Bacidia gigantensis]KAG8525366.1 hypothetical protein KY384_009010 [Bacidia gigantensis]